MLKDDHRTVETLFGRYESLGEQSFKRKATIIEKCVRELSSHAAIEELFLYPALAREAPRGERMADHAIDEHHEVKKILAKLQRMNPQAKPNETDEMMAALIANVRKHIKEEESELFPKLRSALDREALTRMGDLMQMAKKTAPTRPHPRAPSKPPANVLTDLAAGVMDRARDAGRRATRKLTGSR